MKRLIGLTILFLCSFILLFSFEIDKIKFLFIEAMPFFENIYNWIDLGLNSVKDLLGEGFLSGFPHWFIDILIYLVIFVAFSIIYYIIFGLIILIRKGLRRNKVTQVLNGNIIVLSDEERSKFEWKLYQKKFPGWRLFFLFLELLVFAGLIIVRLDVVFTIENGVKFGSTTYFEEIIDHHASNNFVTLDLFSSIASRLGIIGYWIALIISFYIKLMNSIVEAVGFNEIEWILLAIFIILVLVILWGVGSLFAKPYRKFRAKRRAKKMKAKYIAKLEDIELKAYKKSQKENRISQKNRSLYSLEADIAEFDNNVESIADNNKAIEDYSNDKLSQTPEQNYIDDISTGVTDLGIIEEDNNELQKPLFTRQEHFVGDEEHDIILEEEPIIETIEEEDVYYNNNDLNEEETFEKYEPEYFGSLEIEDKVKKYNIDIIEEDSEVIKYTDNDVSPIAEFDEQNKTRLSFKENITDEVVNTESKVVEETDNAILEESNKTIKPINLNKDKTKIVSYIINNTDTSQLSLTEAEKEKIAVKKLIKPVSSERPEENKAPVEEKKQVMVLKPKLNKKSHKNIKPVEAKAR